MFTATPPSVNRRRSAGRKSIGLGEKEQLPFVATRNNYSYGSQFSNMPKPPQLAETKVPLSVALKQQQDASQARMRAEEMERERAAREPGTVEPDDRRSSVASEQQTAPTAVSTAMPPPPRRRSPRQQSEISDQSYSIGFDTTQGMSRSYASEDDLGVALGRKFTQNLADLPSDGSATDEDEEQVEDNWLDGPTGRSARHSDAGSTIGSKHSKEIGQEPVSKHKTPSVQGFPEEIHEEVDQEDLDDFSEDEAPDIYGSDDGDESEEDEVMEYEEGRGSYARDEYIRNGGISKQLELAEQLLPILIEGVKGDNTGPPGGRPDRMGIEMFIYHWNWWLRQRVATVLSSIFFAIFTLSAWLWVLHNGFGVDLRNLDATHFTYERPYDPPSTFAEVQHRMHTIEKVIQDFGYHASREQLKFQEEMRKEVEMLEGKVIDLKEDGDENGKAVEAARRKLEDLDDSIKVFENFREQIQTDFNAHKRMLKKLKEQQEGSMGSIKDSLPEKMVFDVGDDGSYNFPPELEKALAKLIKQTYPSDGPTKFAKTDSETLQRDPNWNDFLKKNDKKLRGLIDDQTGLTYDQYKDQVLLSKGTVTQLIDQKVKENGDWAVNVFWPKIEKEFMERIKQDSVLPILVEDAIKKSPIVIDQAVNKYIKQNPKFASREGSAPSGAAPHTEVPALSVPDYASLLTGGKISPWATSPTFEWSNDKNRWFYSVFGRRRGVIAQPTVAITPTSDVGQCWPFPGDQGNIGIRLALPIFATQISVEHIPKSHAVDISSAPRKIEFWAQFEDEETRERAEKAAARALNEIEWSKDRLWDRESISSPPGPSGTFFDNFVKLGVFKYDINAGNPRIQTWDLPVDLVNLNITTQLVVFKVINNWGHPDYTCLYRVRVHGNPQKISEVMDEQDLDAGKRAIPIHPYEY